MRVNLENADMTDDQKVKRVAQAILLPELPPEARAEVWSATVLEGTDMEAKLLRQASEAIKAVMAEGPKRS